MNEKLETNVPGIFALGDVKGGPAFTHIVMMLIALSETIFSKKATPHPVLRDDIFAHPTLAEGLNTLFMALEN